LLGKGDMLFMTSDASKLKRIQGAYVTDEETNDVVAFLKEQGEPQYNPKVTERQGGTTVLGGGYDNQDDSLAQDAKEVVIKAGKASATLLQRRLRVGYARAARLLDILEEMGVVGPADGSKARDVLVKQGDLEENFSSALDEEEVKDDQITDDDKEEEDEQYLASQDHKNY
ncbi:MAG: segregation ATPase FtsK/SpoIIIE, family, partial [Patescibacteria group bacterium]|nr:segregation ATPase FtsK/SpoIIIE, family [Patescibacteria group bacterium]